MEVNPSASPAPAWHQEPITIGVLLCLLLISIAGFLTRLWMLGDKSLWLDETYSWGMARLSLADMVDRVRHEDVHPPSYYGLLHVWINTFGDSEWSIRMPSALAAAGSFFLASFVGWRVRGLALASLTGLLLAVNPAALQYTQDARFYPIVSFLTLVTGVSQAWFVRTQRVTPLAIYTASAILLMYTHNIGLVVVGVQGIVFCWFGLRQWSSGGGRSILLGSAAAGGVALLAYSPWVPALVDQVEGGGGYVPEPSITLAGATLRGALGLRHTGIFWVLFAAPLLVATALGLYRNRANELVVCMAALAATPVALLVASYIVSPAFDTKRVSAFIPAIAFIAALGIVEGVRWTRRRGGPSSRVGPWVAVAGTAALAVTMGIGALDWYREPPYEDWRSAARDLQEMPGPIYHFPWYLNDPLGYYLDEYGDSRLRRVDYDAELADTPTIAGIDDIDRGAAALVISHATDDEEEAVLEAISRYYRVSAPRAYTDTIWIYELSETTSSTEGSRP